MDDPPSSPSSEEQNIGTTTAAEHENAKEEHIDRTIQDDKLSFEIEKIIGMQKDESGNNIFQVRLVAYTWLPEFCLLAFSHLINEFNTDAHVKDIDNDNDDNDDIDENDDNDNENHANDSNVNYYNSDDVSDEDNVNESDKADVVIDKNIEGHVEVDNVGCVDVIARDGNDENNESRDNVVEDYEMSEDDEGEVEGGNGGVYQDENEAGQIILPEKLVEQYGQKNSYIGSQQGDVLEGGLHIEPDRGFHLPTASVVTIGCGSSTFTNDDLNTNNNTTTTAAPLECGKCQQSFYLKSNLEVHLLFCKGGSSSPSTQDINPGRVILYLFSTFCVAEDAIGIKVKPS